MSEPEITRVEAVEVRPEDLILYRCQQHLTHEAIEQIRVRLAEHFPNNPCLVLPDDGDLQVHRMRQFEPDPDHPAFVREVTP